MRSSSGGFEGLWSCVTRTGRAPSPLNTPRESPQLEKMTYLVLINAQMAVVPDLSSPLATSGIFLKKTKKNNRQGIFSLRFFPQSTNSILNMRFLVKTELEL